MHKCIPYNTQKVMYMNLPNRKLPRLSGYDYTTPGAYFVTICTFEKKCIFGKITPGNMIGQARLHYSPVGQIAVKCLLDLEAHYSNIKIDHWVIMPNHIHMLIRIEERINPFPTAVYDIPNVVGKYKAAVTRAVGNAFMHSERLWQASFYDHIIRNDQDYQTVWQYIDGNPSKWLDDSFYVAESHVF